MSKATEDEERIKKAREAWETANPEDKWIEKNAAAIASKHTWAHRVAPALCKDMVAAFFSGWSSYEQSKGATAVKEVLLNSGLDDQGIIDKFGRRGSRQNTHIYFGAMARNCNASVEGFEYEYELAMAMAVFEEEIKGDGGLIDSVSGDTAQFAACASDYSSSASMLNELIDEFWVEAATNLFNGTVPSAAPFDGSTGGHYATTNAPTDELGSKTGQQIQSLYDLGSIDKGAPKWALCERYDETATPVRKQVPSNFDHIIIAQPSELKLVETIDAAAATCRLPAHHLSRSTKIMLAHFRSITLPF